MGKFLGVNISNEEQQLIQNVIIPKLMKSNSSKLVPDGADILHELILGYDPEKATKKKAEKFEKYDIDETVMYSNIKKALGRSISNDIRNLVKKMKTEYQWSNKMISFVFNYCVSKSKGYDNYILKVAENWYNDGVRTYRDMTAKVSKKS